jgi:LPPG:FO 2-phospho-L-lactate transferase
VGRRVVLLAGGTGGARLATGFQKVLPSEELTVICNTGDDVEHWGVHVSPDVDAVLYRLAGIFDETAGFGVAGDTYRVFEHMKQLGDPGWFRLGDADLAHCLMRTAVLNRGARLTEACAELARRLGVAVAVLPMSDDAVRTWFATDAGCLGFQEYFVRERARPKVEGIEFAGIESARPSAEAVAAVEAADLVVIGPSNPLISIGPILQLLGHQVPRERTVAVSPVVEGRALKGPTVEMMRSLGHDPMALGAARIYADKAATFVLDARDAELQAQIEELGLRVLVTDTVMGDRAGARRLAADILERLP